MSEVVCTGARIDFRTDYRALRHEVIELPVSVTEGIRRFMAESRLISGPQHGMPRSPKLRVTFWSPPFTNHRISSTVRAPTRA